MKYIKNKWTIIGVVLVGIGLLTAFKLEQTKAPQYFTEKVQKGDVQNLVQATGTINAVTTVQVGSQVSGTIQTLFADFNSHVKKDQVVAQIDPSLFQGALLQAKADLADAQANLVMSKANLDKAQCGGGTGETRFQSLYHSGAGRRGADAAVGYRPRSFTERGRSGGRGQGAGDAGRRAGAAAVGGGDGGPD